MAAAETRHIRLWQDKVETEVEISGAGRHWYFCTGPGGCATNTASTDSPPII
jgi:hypothetical protein